MPSTIYRTCTPCAPRSCGHSLPTLSFSDVYQILSAESIDEWGHAHVHETGRYGSSTTCNSRRCSNGPASSISAAVRCGCCETRSSHVLLSRVLLRASQDRSRIVLRRWRRALRLRTSRARALHGHVRLMTVGCRTQERGRAIHAMCTRVDRSKDMARPRGYPGSSVELGSGLGLSGQPKLVYYNMVWVAGRVGIGSARKHHTPS